MLKKILLWCALFLSWSAAMTEAAPVIKEMKFAPLNPEYVKYLEGKSDAKAVPSPIDWSYLKKPKAGQTRAASDLPASFDLSSEGMTPPVEDQRNWGTCWAFAAVAAMESNLLTQGRTWGDDVSLSEFHLAYWAYSFDTVNKLPGFTRNGYAEGENPIFDNGGRPQQTTAILSRGTGPVLAKDAPYPDTVDDMSWDEWKDFLPPAPYAESRYRLKRALFYSREDTDDIKRALMTTGGLYVAYNSYDDPFNGYNYYDSDETALPNHAVLLVGWDDDYPAVNFQSEKDGENPPGPGAWKIQNSWGEKFGKDGYFYISYYDKSFLNGMDALSLEVEPIEHDGIYLHDPLGFCTIVQGNEFTEWNVANVFEAERDEDVVSAGFVTANVGMEYEVRVYKDIPAGEGPDTGKQSYVQSGVTEAVGYYTVQFPEPVGVKKGERFAVAVKMKTDDDEAYLPVETMLPGFSDNAAAAPGESYVLANLDGEGEKWLDAYGLLLDDAYYDGYSPRNFNVCVKAFTVASGKSGDGDGGGGCSAGGGIALPFLAAVFWAARIPAKKK